MHDIASQPSYIKVRNPILQSCFYVLDVEPDLWEIVLQNFMQPFTLSALAGTSACFIFCYFI